MDGDDNIDLLVQDFSQLNHVSGSERLALMCYHYFELSEIDLVL